MLENLEEYILKHSTPEPDYLQAIERETYVHIYNARMISGRLQGRLLALLSKMIQPQSILEIGTFTGYSALCLAEGLTGDAQLITMEKNDELEAIIRQNLARSPLGEKVHLMVGDALQILPNMTDVFDLIFMDGDKCEYEAYYRLIFPLWKRGGWLLADNTLWDGHIIDEKYDKDKQTVGLRTFNNMLAADERVEQLILPLRDGLTIVHKK